MSRKYLTNIDLALNELQNARLQSLSAAPTAGTAGRVFYNSSTALVGWDTGSVWRYMAPLDSPAFTGNPTAPTQTAGNNSTRIATTAYVDAAVTAGSVPDNGVTNVKLADMATSTIKGRATTGTGDPEDLTASQVRTILNVADGATANSADATLLARANHTGTQLANTISDFATAVAATAAVTANTAKVSNATHTGDVTGSTALTIANNVVTNAKLADMATARIKGRVTASTGDPEDLTAAQVKTLLAIAIADVTGLQTALDGKAATSHTHTASAITDFNTAVDTRVAAYWDSIAGTDADVDTIREVLDLVLANAAAVQEQIARHNATIGDGTSTSIAVTHNLNSLDVTVEVYEISSGATVLPNVTRTNANVVTIGVNPAPASNSLRVVIKK